MGAPTHAVETFEARCLAHWHGSGGGDREAGERPGDEPARNVNRVQEDRTDTKSDDKTRSNVEEIPCGIAAR